MINCFFDGNKIQPFQQLNNSKNQKIQSVFHVVRHDLTFFLLAGLFWTGRKGRCRTAN